MVAQVVGGRALLRDRPRRRDVVGRQRVAEDGQHAGVLDVRRGRGLLRDPFEKRRQLDVGGVRLPNEHVALWDGQFLPLIGPLEDLAVAAAEHAGVDLAHRYLHLRLRRPDVAQVDVLPIIPLPERLRLQIDVHPARQRVRNDQRRRGEVIRADLRVDAALEVAVAREHGRREQVALLDRARDRLRQRP